MNFPLEEKKIAELLRIKPDGSLYKRESTILEFKENFDWDVKSARVKYLKSIAAFSIKIGGYLIFGVSDSPRKLIGITKAFMEIDDSQLSQFINQFLSPSPIFEREEYIIDGKKFGVLYVYPAEKKPMVCIRDYDKIVSESVIYYRYNGQSCTIRSGDLLHLLEEAKQKENNKWMQLFTKASSIGVHNAGIYDANSGTISTQKGNSYILDWNLLKRLKILDKYSQHEDGAEAVKIIGEIDKTGTVINRPFAIHDDDIIQGFLLDKDIISPLEHIEAMCYQASGYLPIYYFIKKAQTTNEAALKIVKKVKRRSQAKTRLVNRLQNDDKLKQLNVQFPLDNTSAVRAKRSKYYNQIINNENIEFKNSGEVKRLLEAICNLKEGMYEPNYIKEILMEIFNNHYHTGLSTFIRQTICYIDIIENT